MFCPFLLGHVRKDFDLDILEAKYELEKAIYEHMHTANQTVPNAVPYMEMKQQYSKCVIAQLEIEKHRQAVSGKSEGKDFDLAILEEKLNLAREEYTMAQSVNEKVANAVSLDEMSRLYNRVLEAQHNIDLHIQTSREKQPLQDQEQSQVTIPSSSLPQVDEALQDHLFNIIKKQNALFNSQFTYSSDDWRDVQNAEREYYHLSDDPTSTLDDFIKAKRKEVEEFAKMEAIENIEMHPLANPVIFHPMRGLVAKSEYDILRLIKMKRENQLSQYLLNREIEGNDPDERYRTLKAHYEQLKDIDENDVLKYFEKIQTQQALLCTRIEKILNIYERGERWKTFQGVDVIWFYLFEKSMRELQATKQQEIDLVRRLRNRAISEPEAKK